MAQIIITVEALDDKDNWCPVEIFSGEEDEVIPEAETIVEKWKRLGWKEDEIRISKSSFPTFRRKWRDG